MAPLLVLLLLLSGLLVSGLLLRQHFGRATLHRVIVEADTPAGKAFDLLLLIAISASVLAVILESDSRVALSHPHLFEGLEWGFTLLFGLEYVLRLLCTSQPLRYATSFFGVVDLIAILPSFLGLMLAGTKYFLVVRILRLLRVFRILKLGEYLQESELLWRAIVASRRKIIVFLMTMVLLVVIIGALMYLIEGESGGFVSIPVGIYWAVVTVTTVGYGDVAPVTPLGRFVASIVMLLGYSIIAVPTGILTVGIQQARRRQEQVRRCPSCGKGGHQGDARFCRQCGNGL
ncbi:ion transporter [Synechococcus sp. CBW1006]|uniref:ion transporter n=1 Tax=Synechococcus sp. CBW1006 TaxID=1353138 RepID=UPI0018CE430E|nr:ion transporter [Synechococcus sp. CBW1006]QPN67888.1 ion transporter [Synechococcus sp. CBW1006]